MDAAESGDTSSPPAPTHVVERLSCSEVASTDSEAAPNLGVDLVRPRGVETTTGEPTGPYVARVRNDGPPVAEAQVVVGPLGAHPLRSAQCFRTFDAPAIGEGEFGASLRFEVRGLYAVFLRVRAEEGGWTWADLDEETREPRAAYGSLVAVDDATAKVSRVRAATVHLGCLTEDWDERRAALLRGLEAFAPDAVALQGDCVDGSGVPQSFVMQGELAARLGVGFENFRLDTGTTMTDLGEFTSGQALLTSFPIDAHWHLELPETTAVLLATDVRIDSERRLRLLAADFSPDDTSSGWTAEVAREVPDRGAMVVFGSFGFEPDDARYGSMTRVTTDAWASAGSDDGFTYPSSNPDARVDYLFSVGTTADDASVGEAAGANHHLPVQATFPLP